VCIAVVIFDSFQSAQRVGKALNQGFLTKLEEEEKLGGNKNAKGFLR
jgi:hypothetical protein